MQRIDMAFIIQFVIIRNSNCYIQRLGKHVMLTAKIEHYSSDVSWETCKRNLKAEHSLQIKTCLMIYKKVPGLH